MLLELFLNNTKNAHKNFFDITTIFTNNSVGVFGLSKLPFAHKNE